MSKGWGRRRRRTTTTRRRTTTTKQKQQQNKNNIPTGGYSHAWAEACVAKLAKHRATTQNTALMAMLRRAVSLVVLFLPSAASCLLELCFNSLLLVLFSFLFFGWNGVGFSFFLSFFLSLGCLFDWSKRHQMKQCQALAGPAQMQKIVHSKGRQRPWSTHKSNLHSPYQKRKVIHSQSPSNFFFFAFVFAFVMAEEGLELLEAVKNNSIQGVIDLISADADLSCKNTEVCSCVCVCVFWDAC